MKVKILNGFMGNNGKMNILVELDNDEELENLTMVQAIKLGTNGQEATLELIE